jgi:hypothetical protein
LHRRRRALGKRKEFVSQAGIDGQTLLLRIAAEQLEFRTKIASLTREKACRMGAGCARIWAGVLMVRTSLRRLENCEGHAYERLSWDANPQSRRSLATSFYRLRVRPPALSAAVPSTPLRSKPRGPLWVRSQASSACVSWPVGKCRSMCCRIKARWVSRLRLCQG